MSAFESLLVGVLALLAVAWMWPGVRDSWQRSRAAPDRDWLGALLPLGVVTLFVVLLLALA